MWFRLLVIVEEIFHRTPEFCFRGKQHSNIQYPFKWEQFKMFTSIKVGGKTVPGGQNYPVL